ncbi:MAG TPA: ATP-binding protein [Candidatus Eisenbacteria bacterium]|nr:ATP-binding protein [Candidatus Eisenbacteria bacterium]
MRRVEDHLAQLVRDVTDYAIFLLTPEGIVSTWNAGAERIKGYRADEIIGRHFSIFYTPDVAASGWPAVELERAVRFGRHEDEGWRVRKDGSRFWANVVITAMRGPDGEIEGFSKITRDLTERMRNEERLRQAAAHLEVRIEERTAELEHANRSLQAEIEERTKLEGELRRRVSQLAEEDRRKNEFLATLAHELRNPLAPIQYAHEILRLSAGDPGRSAEAHAILTRQLHQMVRLIDDLLDLSRITRNKLELRRERVDLATVLQDAAETTRPLIEAREHRVVIHHAETPIVLHADRARLAQVFSNLLSNAAKFTARGGSIEITAGREGTEGVVRVRDTGIGITPGMLPRIFDMFVQADRSLERTQSGLGIGLTLVQRIVQMHGGTVEVRSGGPGTGSEFTVRLPAEPEANGTVPARDERSAALAAEGATRRRVLVADDNEDAVRSLSLVLRAMGHEVVTARNGEEAVRLAETSRPDLALLDIGMPLVNGYDAARRIREQPWGAGIPLIALTGWGLEDDRRQASESGFDRHLVKPVDVDTLRALISELPGNRGPEERPTGP